MWNQSGTFLVNRSPDFSGKPQKPIHLEDPRFNSHTTDLKPLFPNQMEEFPYIVTRNKNSINLIDINNRHIQPLIEIRNAELFCEKITISRVDGFIKLMYVTWHNDRTFVKEITLPEEFMETLRSAADL